MEELRIYPTVGRTGIGKVREAAANHLTTVSDFLMKSWGSHRESVSAATSGSINLPFSSIFQISLVLLCKL